MDDESLFMLCDPKKCKKTQPKMDVYINNYKSHKNELNTLNNLDNNDINIKKNEVISEVNTDVIPEVIPEVTTDVPEAMIDVLEHINYIDNFILNNNYDTNMEKINDYLIDLLFLIKSKKSKK